MNSKNVIFTAKRFFVLMLVATLLLSILMLVSCSSNDSEDNGTGPEDPDISTLPVPDDFSFSITWNVFGDSYYDSVDGTLVKVRHQQTDEHNVATLLLTDEQKLAIYRLLTEDIDLFSYPDQYDPFRYTSDPSQTIIVTMSANGKTKTVGCIDVGLGSVEDCSSKESKDFMKVVEAIVDILTSTEEWKSLPELEGGYF